MSQVTYIGLLIDASGSMRRHRSQVVESVNEFLEAQRDVEGAAFLTLQTFNQSSKTIIEHALIDNVRAFSETSYKVGGLTALYTSIRKLIEKVQLQIAADGYTPEEVGAVFCVITDGMNNASARGDEKWVAATVKELEAVNEWDYLYIGIGDEEAHRAQSVSMSIDSTKFGGMSSNAASSGELTKSLVNIGQKVAKYRGDKSGSRVTLQGD